MTSLQKSALITLLFSLLFGAVLYTVALNSEPARLVILTAFAIPGYAAFCWAFYRWIGAEKPELEEQTGPIEVIAYDYERDAEKEIAYTIDEILAEVPAKGS